MTVTIRKAKVEDVGQLNSMMLAGLKDKTSEVYKVNIEQFGIPDEYVRRTFSTETLTNTVKDEQQLFLVAVDEGKLIGFAQTIRQGGGIAELDRIFLVPESTGKGIGTEFLRTIMDVLRKENFSKLTVKAGKNEMLARNFYEKNGFRLVEEVCVEAPWGRKLDLAIYEIGVKD